MNYSTVAVFLDSSPASKLRLDFALEFAARHHAHLTGIHMSYGPLLAFDPTGKISEVALSWEKEVLELQKKSKEEFTHEAKNAGVPFDWDCYRDTAMEQVLTRARVADICIVGQASTGSNDNNIDRNFFSRFAVNIGRPVLFIPYGKKCSAELNNIVVAWSGSREAARAISDAMPLLKAAKVVNVVTVTAKQEYDYELPDVDIAAYLARHHVNAVVDKTEKIYAEATDFILSQIESKKADFLVMGAFGHTRFSEFILGGMTRSILKKMTVPVLMSH